MVGLLGGSFNPAHDGHRHIALIALKRLRLDAVWLMVSPQNPLKSTTGMAPLPERIATAQAKIRHPRVIPTTIETELGTRYTADTLTVLTKRFMATQFIWLMGADNLVQIGDWERWPDIFHAVPIAVFARAPWSLRALASKAAQRFARRRVPERYCRRLRSTGPPAWVFLSIRLHPASASEIRKRRSQITPSPVFATPPSLPG